MVQSLEPRRARFSIALSRNAFRGIDSLQARLQRVRRNSITSLMFSVTLLESAMSDSRIAGSQSLCLEIQVRFRVDRGCIG